MYGHITPTVVSAALLMMTVGCANPGQKRITLLEETNKNLTSRLNLTSTELATVREDQLYLDQRLHQAMNETLELRNQLAEQQAAPVPEAVAPGQAAPGWTSVPGGAMIAIEGNMLFTSGNAALRKEARRALDSVVSVLQGNLADKDILVIGHTDDQPIKKSGWVDNYQLSTERSLAVVRYLRDRGVAAARLIAGGCGENRPRVAPVSEADRAANRRVEIFALNPFPRVGQP